MLLEDKVDDNTRRKTENSIRKEFYEKRFLQGEEKKQVEIAESMLNDGVSIENIENLSFSIINNNKL